MTPEDRDERDPLRSIIADFLEAENRGESVDRDALITANAEHADSLREFFASHDRLKSAADVDPPTLPPRSGEPSSEDPTIAPTASPIDDPPLPRTRSDGDAPTLPSTESASKKGEPTVGDQVQYFGDYELLEEIARGGMGVVFKARQINLNRIVALKMILSGQFAGQEDVQRFYTEAEAAANLDHPGIVPIFEIGEHAGQHYFSMGYIEGESLAHKVVDGPLPPRDAAELVKKICDAMAYAHERGVIHRDLKPANILIDQSGQPKVTDFGLAKKTEADSNLTGTGQILGTPAYMPPEQASGKTVGPLADIYSLGAILYCLLTGRPPFQAACPMDTLLSVLDKEPVPPRQLNPSVPIDLETICLKCLSKASDKRYATSSDLAEELDRFVTGKPIHARPVGQIERGWRWCKRNPTLSATGAIAALLLLTIGIGSPLVAWQQIQVEKEQAESELQRAEKLVYATQISSAQRQWESGNTSGAWESLNATQRGLRGWEYDYVFTALRGDQLTLEATEAVATLAVNPNGKAIAVGGQQGAVQVWDTATQKESFTLTQEYDRRAGRPSFSADGKSLRLNAMDCLTVCDVNGGVVKTKIDLTSEEGDIVRSTAFSADGRQFVVGGGRLVNEYENRGRHHRGMISVWDVATGKPIHPYLGRSRGSVDCVAFSPDGKRIVSGGHDGLFLWDLVTGQETLTFENGAMVTDVAFSADGERLIGNRYRLRTVAIWDVSTGKQLHQLPGAGTTVRTMAFSPDGKCVLTAYDRDDVIKVWDVTKEIWIIETGTEKLNLEYGGTCGIAFSPDGTLIASAGKNRTVKIWELETGREVFSGQGHTNAVTSLAFSTDGQRLITGSADRSVRIWEFARSRDYSLLQGHNGGVGHLVFSADGRRFVSAGKDGFARTWDLATGAQIGFQKYSLGIPSVAFVAGSNQVVSGTSKIASWDSASSPLESPNADAQERPPLKLPEPYVSIAISPTGNRIVAAPHWTQPTAGTRMIVMDRKTGQPIDATELPEKFFHLAFSPDGERIGLAYRSFVEIRDVESGAVVLTLEGGRPPIAFSRDGKWIATGYGVAGNSAQVVDAEDGQRKTLLVGHTSAIRCLTFSPDSDRIVSGSGDKMLKVWELPSGQETITLHGHSFTVTSVEFHPEGSLIVSGDADGVIRLWNATHALVTPKRPGDVWIGRWEVAKLNANEPWDFLLSVSRNGEDYVAEIENLPNITITSIDNTNMQLSWPYRNADGTPSLLKMTLHLSGSRSLEGSVEVPGQEESRLEGNRRSFGDGRSVSKQSDLANSAAILRIPLRLDPASKPRNPVGDPSVEARRNPFDDMNQPQADDPASKPSNPLDTPSVKERRNPFDDPEDRPGPQTGTDTSERSIKATFARLDANVVTLRTDAGTILNIPIAKLDDADRTSVISNCDQKAKMQVVSCYKTIRNLELEDLVCRERSALSTC